MTTPSGFKDAYRQIVEGGKRSFQRVIDEFPKRHWSKRPVEEEYPVSLQKW